MNTNRPNRHKRKAAALLAAILLSASFAAHADEREDLEKLRATVLALIDALVKNRILPKDKADAMMREAETRATTRLAQAPPPETGPDGKKIVRVPYVPEAVKVQMRDQIKAEVLAETRAEHQSSLAAADSGSRFQFEGDVRLRFDYTMLNPTNTPAINVSNLSVNSTRAADFWGSANMINGIHNSNTQEDASRTRLRVRAGVNAIISDTVSAGVAISTGSTTKPTSTNQTMGQGFNKYTVVLDRAFIKYEPESWLSMSGGRIRNPYFGTDLLWADDLNLEGFALSLKPQLSPVASAFLTAGWFPLSINNPKQSRDRSLLAMQGGFDWQIGQKDNRVKLAAALYDYRGIEGVPETTNSFLNSPDYLSSEYSASYRQRGNTLFRINAPNGGANPDTATNWGLASSFRELNLTGAVDIAMFDPAHVILTGDLVSNLGFDRSKIQSRTGVNIPDGASLGYLGRIQVGAPKMVKRGDWSASLAYRYLGSDAVLDAFTNDDFGLGGTNSKGTILGMNYGVAKNTWVSVKWMSSDLIDSLVPSNSLNTKFSVDLFLLDLNARF